MLLAKIAGYQYFNRVAQHFILFVSKQLPRLLVGVDDKTRSIDQDHRAWCHFQQCRAAQLGISQFVVSLFQLPVAVTGADDQHTDNGHGDGAQYRRHHQDHR